MLTDRQKDRQIYKMIALLHEYDNHDITDR